MGKGVKLVAGTGLAMAGAFVIGFSSGLVALPAMAALITGIFLIGMKANGEIIELETVWSVFRCIKHNLFSNTGRFR